MVLRLVSMENILNFPGKNERKIETKENLFKQFSFVIYVWRLTNNIEGGEMIQRLALSCP